MFWFPFAAFMIVFNLPEFAHYNKIQTQMDKKKLLILDGISGISLGQEMADAFRLINTSTIHVASEQLHKKAFYKPVSALKKAIHKQIYKKKYYKNPRISNHALKTLLQEQQPEIVLVIGFLYRFFDLQLIQALSEELGFKLYLYDTDSCNLFNNKRELVYFFTQELPLYDHIFSFSKTTTEFINKTDKLNASYFPFGANPVSIPDNIEKKQDVLFIGSADMRRIFLLEHLTEHQLCVYGSKWQRNNELISARLKAKINYQPVWGKELQTLLHQSKIILNITRSTFYGVETGVNLRIFETLAARGFLLTEYCAELNELFETGKHIETYRDSEELKDKVNYYLKNDNKREKIALQGHQYFLKKYTWEHRIKELFSNL